MILYNITIILDEEIHESWIKWLKNDYLKNMITETKNAETLQNQCIIFPSYPDLTRSQIKFITSKIKSFLKGK